MNTNHQEDIPNFDPTSGYSHVGHKREWQCFLSPSLQSSAIDIILNIAEQLLNPDFIATIARESRKKSQLFMWGGASLPNGWTGLALCFLYLVRSFPDKKWEDAAHQYLHLAASSTQTLPFHKPGIMNGSSGFALVLSQFCEYEPRYQQMSNRVHRDIAQQILTTTWKRPSAGVSTDDYDLICGASGILGYLVSSHTSEPIVEDAIHTLLDYLIWLNGEDTEQRKRWYIPPIYMPQHHLNMYPNGYFNLGLAHGIPGPLSALAFAWQSGYRLPGHLDAIKTFSKWVIDHQVHDQWGINWPSGIHLEKSWSPESWQQISPTRAAWCYGVPGIASSLLHAGSVLKDQTFYQLAIDSLEDLLHRSPEYTEIISPTLCHGLAGLLMIYLRFAHFTHHPTFEQAIPIIVQQILDHYNTSLPFGICDQETIGTFVDDPGFLTGVAGVILALLAATTSTEPAWDRSLLIA